MSSVHERLRSKHLRTLELLQKVMDENNELHKKLSKEGVSWGMTEERAHWWC